MGQWIQMGMSMAKSTQEIMGAAQGMAQDQQDIEMTDDTRRLGNMQNRNLLVSEISQAVRRHPSGTVYY